MISIETTTKLLKLHFQWPQRKDHNGKDSEPLEFYKWLFINHHDRPEVMEMDDLSYIEDFLEKNKHVLWPSRQDEEKWANLRLEPRIRNDVQVELSVIESPDTSLTGTSLSGRTLDIGLHGMRLTVSDRIPAGTLMKLRVYKDEADARVYDLVAELRWSDELENGYLVGVKLKEDAGFKNWQSEFGEQFVKPVIGNRRRKPDG